MSRHLLSLGVASLLAAALLAVFLIPTYVGGQAIPIRGTAATQSGRWAIDHQASVVHVAGIITGFGRQGANVTVTGTALDVNCTGCAAASVVAVTHISSVLHIQVSGAGTPTSSLPVRCVNTAGTAFEACGGAGATADAVNVFHQSTIRHVSSVTHIAGTLSLVARDGTYAALAGTSLLVASAASQSGVWTIQAIHQAVVSHVSSVLHMAGSVRIMGSTPNNQLAMVTHSGALTVTCQTAAGVAESCAGAGGASDAVNVFHQSTVRHISSLTHVVIVDWQRWAHVQTQAFQSGSWTLQAAHQGGEWNLRHLSSVLHVQVSGAGTPTASLSVRCVNTAGTAFADCGGSGGDAVNVFHQSTVRHISSVTHIASAGLALANQALAVRCVDTGGTTFQACGGGADPGSVVQSSVWTIQATHQGGEWNVRHIGSVTHVAIAGGHYGTGQLSMHVSGVSNIGSGRENTGTTPMVCHSTLAVHFSGGSFSGASGFGQAIIHLTSTNRGINQSTWRIYICSVVLYGNALSPKGQTGLAGGVAVAARHFAATYSLVEGTGTGCATGRAGVLGFQNAGGSILIDVHSAVSLISPFPFMSTNVPGNDLCLLTSNRNSRTYVTGVISYRAAP